jgi:hypothetical protein
MIFYHGRKGKGRERLPPMAANFQFAFIAGLCFLFLITLRRKRCQDLYPPLGVVGNRHRGHFHFAGIKSEPDEWDGSAIGGIAA